MNQVDLVNPGGLGEFPRIDTRGGNGFVFLVFDHLRRVDAETLQFGRYRGFQFCQVHNAERGGLSAALLGTYFNEIVSNRFADFNGAHPGVLAQFVQPVGIVPADAGLGFLTADHVIGILGKHDAVFDGAHQAGVKADEVELDAAVFERGIEAGQ